MMNPGNPDNPERDEDATVVDPAYRQRSDEEVSQTPSQTPDMDSEKTVISQSPLGHDSSVVYRAKTPAEIGATLVGQTLGHYLLEEFIGGGGMGAVFKAKDTMLGRTVAVKVLSRDQGDDDTLRRFKNEAQSAARLDHGNIARVHYVGVDDGWNFIVFEYIEGDNLRDVVDQGGPLSIEDALLFTLQVAEALDHAALRDVVHRDIKPSNVLITPEGRAKLVDMGLARLHQVEAGESDITASGVTLGTFDYISPEQARDPRLADVRSDLYSLGCTLFFMLTGKPPFPEGTVLQKLLSHSSEAPPDPREFRTDLPHEVSVIVHRLLEKKPERRYQNSGELIRDLSRVANQFGLEESVTYLSRPSQASGLQWLDKVFPWAAPLAVLFLLVGGLELYSNWVRQPDQLPTLNFPSSPTVVEGTANPTDGDADPTENNGDATEEDAGPVPPVDETSDAGDVDASPTLPDRSIDESLPDGERTSDGPSSEVDGDGEAGSVIPVIDVEDDTTSALVDSDGATDEAQVAPRTLVVGPPGIRASLASDQIWASSLSAAFSDDEILRVLNTLDTIELRYDGFRDEDPMRLPANLDLVIRGASGSNPGLLFRPEWNGNELPSPSMFELRGGSLEIRDVAIEMRLPAARLYDRWSLFELRTDDRLKLSRCAISIDNSRPDGAILHEEAVAVVDVLTTPDETRMIGPPSVSVGVDNVAPVVPIRIDDCVIRGDAMLVRATETTPINLRWDNGLLVTRERVLRIGGTDADAYDDSAHIHVGLRRITAIVADGLAELTDTTDRPRQLPVELVCDQCVFVSHPGAAMVVHRGDAELQRYGNSLKVEGGSNFFQDVEVFWRVSAIDGENEFDWNYWQERWGAGGMPSFSTEVLWVEDQVEVELIAPEKRSPSHYRLQPTDENRAFQAEAGFNFLTLPRLSIVDRVASQPLRSTEPPTLRPTDDASEEPPPPSPD